MTRRTRHTLDAYYTAERLTDALIHSVLRRYLTQRTTILEPCAGKASIVKSFESHGFNNIETWDIDTNLVVDRYCDASDATNWVGVDVDWVVTNPPYFKPDCQLIVENAYNTAKVGVAMLLRLSYDEPCADRAEFLKTANLAHQIIFNPRPKFRIDCNGSDNVTSSWFVWLKTTGNMTEKIYCDNWQDIEF